MRKRDRLYAAWYLLSGQAEMLAPDEHEPEPQPQSVTFINQGDDTTHIDQPVRLYIITAASGDVWELPLDAGTRILVTPQHARPLFGEGQRVHLCEPEGWN